MSAGHSVAARRKGQHNCLTTYDNVDLQRGECRCIRSTVILHLLCKCCHSDGSVDRSIDTRPLQGSGIA